MHVTMGRSDEPFVTHSSDGIGSADASYHITKFRDRVRKQWALTVHTPNVLDIAAYFRSEQHARQFAEAFGLTITEARPLRGAKTFELTSEDRRG